MTSIEKPIAGGKWGSGLNIKDDGATDIEAIHQNASQVAEVYYEYHPFVVVSGAVAAGKRFVRDNRRRFENNGVDISHFGYQEFASFGSDTLSMAWKEALAYYGVPGGQVMANHNQMVRGSVLMRGLLHGMSIGKVPIINENDQENLFEKGPYEEVEEGLLKKRPEDRKKDPGIDNDFAGAKGAKAIKDELEEEGIADVEVNLVMFTEVGGFEIDGVVQPVISAQDEEALLEYCYGVGPMGTGGMGLKVGAAILAAESGINTWISSPQNRFLDILRGAPVHHQITRVVQ